LQQAMQAARGSARFRITGADVVVEGLDLLPEEVRAIIDAARQGGRLWSHLGVEAADREALAFAEKLGVMAVLVETAAEVPDILGRLETAAKSRSIGIDIETAGKGERPWLRINLNGAPAAIQPKSDASGLDPHQARIGLVQLYAGGDRCYVLRGEPPPPLPGFSQYRTALARCRAAGLSLMVEGDARHVDYEREPARLRSGCVSERSDPGGRGDQSRLFVSPGQ